MPIKTYKPQIRTKNFSSAPLKGSIGEFPVRSIVRLGSRTSTEDAFPKSFGRRPIIEINTVEAIENSRSKLLMKDCFAVAKVPQADWWELRGNNTTQMRHLNSNIDYDGHPQDSIHDISTLPYPILAKRIFGFKGHGMVKLDNQEQLEEWIDNNNTDGYYFEAFKNYAKEYRCHCTKDGIFMTWRKLRRADADNRWFFNSSNCNWVGEEHPLFNRPSNFDQVEQDCIKALLAVGLDIGSFDVRIQSSSKSSPEYILVEVNSAPALGEQGIEEYKKQLNKLITDKL